MRLWSQASLVFSISTFTYRSHIQFYQQTGPERTLLRSALRALHKAEYEKIVIERMPCAVPKKLKQWLTGINEQRLRSRNAKGTLYFAGGGGSGGPALRTASLFLTLPPTAEVIDCANLSIVA